MSSSQDEDFPSGEQSQSRDATLPDEIVLRKDYSCYCTVCKCTLYRVKDAVQHANGKRHKRAFMIKNFEKHGNLKRLTDADEDNNAKKMKSEETEEEKQAGEMLSQVFDETFHSGIVALADNYYCKVCRCMIGNNRQNVKQHRKGRPHQLALEKCKSCLLSGTIEDDTPVQEQGQLLANKYVAKTKNSKRKTVYYCKLCDFRTKEHDAIEMHVKDPKHLENVQLEVEKEMRASSEDHYGYRDNDYGGGTVNSRRFAEEYYTMSVGSGYDQHGSYNNTGYYNRGEQDIQSKPKHPLHSDYQQGITQNKWEHSSEEHAPDQGKQHPSPQVSDTTLKPSLTDKKMETALVNNDPSLKSQVNPVPPNPQQAQAPFFPHVQPCSVPFTQQSQRYCIPLMPPQPNPIPFIPSPQLATVTFSQPQKTSFPVPSHAPESTDQSKMSDATFNGLPGFITSENDAEVVIDIIDSLLHTYLKYRVQALPGSLMKLLRKTAKGEENVTSANKDITNQISQNPQNNKVQSVLSSKDTGLFPSASCNNGKPSVSSKGPKKESCTSHQTAPKTGSMGYGPYRSSENDDSYDQRSYIEDQLKRAFAIRSVAGRHSEDTTSMKAKQIESSIVDFIKQCRASVSAEKRTEVFTTDLFKNYGSSSKEKSVRNPEQTEPPTTSTYKHCGYSNNEKHSRHPAEQAISDLSKQYKRKEDKYHATKSNESLNADFTDHHNKISGIVDRSLLNMFPHQNQNFRKDDRTSKNVHHDTQSFLDLWKKYKFSGTYS